MVPTKQSMETFTSMHSGPVSFRYLLKHFLECDPSTRIVHRKEGNEKESYSPSRQRVIVTGAKHGFKNEANSHLSIKWDQCRLQHSRELNVKWI